MIQTGTRETRGEPRGRGIEPGGNKPGGIRGGGETRGGGVAPRGTGGGDAAPKGTGGGAMFSLLALAPYNPFVTELEA